MNTPTPAEGGSRSEAAGGGLRLRLPLQVAGLQSEVELEPGHSERLLRMAAYRAIQRGLLDPAEPVTARLLPGRLRARHGGTDCLDTCRVELRDRAQRQVDCSEFPRTAFAAFALARASHMTRSRGLAGNDDVAYSLHADGGASDEALPLELGTLPALSLRETKAGAVAHGNPDGSWIATFITPSVAEGLAGMAGASRTRRVEVAARAHARVGFDESRHCFIRILDRLVLTRAAVATSVSVVSSAASWADFLDVAASGGVLAPSSAHTHLHLGAPPANGKEPGEMWLDATAEPCISIDDIVTHYVTFTHPLSAALIASVYPDRHQLDLYGYSPEAQLLREPGYWVLPDDGAPV